MEVSSPVWTMTRLCPVCGQGRCLAFVVCPLCAHLAIHCDEEGSVFLDPHDLSTTANPSESMCPGCKRQAVIDFDVTTDARIRLAGFQVADYE